ncbi:MAG TPA: amidohydrolase family protein [Mycobacteriales bacterium]|nr:amidohydrolase family protein [Mycobacteriales bacterium]
MAESEALHLRGVVLPDDVERDLYVTGGRITHQPVPGAETVLRGGWLLPGLVDAHCHVGLSPDGPVTEPAVLAAQARADRDGGALLIRDCGSPVDTRGLLDAPDLPRLIRAGRHLARPKRYIRELAAEIEPDQLVAAVTEQAGYGGGWVKLVGDWIDRDAGDLAPLWPADVLRAAVDRAHQLGARVAVHVFGEAALPDLISAGVDSIEHGTGLSDDQLGTLASGGTALVPTLINIENFPGLAAQADARYPAYAGHMRQLHATAAERVRAAHQAGVPVFAGTDAGGGIGHGRIVDEIRALHAAGLPAPAALAAGSWSARNWLGLPALTEGAPADLIAFRTDPRCDLATLHTPTLTILRGRRIR